MAPLDDLIHSFPIAFKDGFDAAVPAVLNPTFYPQSEHHLLRVVPEKDSLHPSFNDHPCPYLFHMNPLRKRRSAPIYWARSKPSRRLPLSR